MGFYRKCKHCGKPFFADGTVKYCSKKCKAEALRIYQRAYMAARREREAAEREKTAKEAAARGEEPPKPAAAKKAAPEKAALPHFCGICGKPLHGRAWQKYCSPKCSREAERRRERAAYDRGDRRKNGTRGKLTEEKRAEAEAVLREAERQRKAAAPAPTGVQTGLTMDQIAAEARRQHMSYGEYRQKLLVEQMRREKR